VSIDGTDRRRVLVVGASAGIGKGIATRLVERGDLVVFGGRRRALLEAAVDAAGGGHPVIADVSDPHQCTAMVDGSLAWLGGLDLVVFAASSSRLGLLRDTSAEEWHRVVHTNLLGPNFVIRAAIDHLAGGALVALLSSDSVGNPLPGLVPYAATKAGLEELIRGWRVEHPQLRFANVTVGSTGGTDFTRDFDMEIAAELLPKWVARGQIPARSMTPDDLGATIADMLSIAVAHPGVDCHQLTLRAPGEPYSGDLGRAVRAVKPGAP
jgi:NAD(P)-dependent dehydrogenase (short-subunit alcohol dehydrogenase family)